MTKKILVILLTLCLAIVAMTVSPFATASITPDTTWYNTTDTTFTLYDAADLAGLASLVNAGNDFSGKTIVLGNSIDLNNEVWTPIGTYYYPFSGTFDGSGYTVSGLYINNSSAGQQALFGYNGGTVKNVTVSGNVTGYVSVAGVVGYNDSGTVTNCINNVVVSAYSFVGGVVGTNNDNGTVTNCYNNGSISGNGNVGGVVGVNYGTMTNCCNNGSITNSATGYDFVGGVVGYNSSSVTNCYNSGAVSGYRCVGGVVGYNTSTVKNCYNSGAVSCTSQTAGGVVGSNSSGSVNNCYYLSTTASAAYRTNDGTLTNVESKTSTQFASGEVTWLLTGGVTDGTQAWYQALGTDSYPVLDSTYGTVYYGTNCKGTSAYSNTNLSTSGGHIYTSTVTTEATCGATGLMTYTCSVCGESYTETIAATGNHIVVTDEAVAATCTSTGLTEGSHCSVCNAVIVAQEEVAALGHDYEISYFTWADGYKSATATLKCINCSDEQTVNATVTVENYYGMYVYVATARYGANGGTYSSVKTVGTVDMSGSETNSTEEVVTEEVETEEPVEGTDTETEADEEAEAETNPTTGIVIALLPMAVALAGAVAGKKRLG
ncbi:MAG: hypothetical protein LUH18_10300 [Oscillospiraceae bacterium]|nr:hypothetical protein [Oscillospiraceae bacterium]